MPHKPSSGIYHRLAVFCTSPCLTRESAVPKPNFIPQKEQEWIDARRRYRLSDAQIQMARELGMSPDSFGKLANHSQQAWKSPLPEYLENLYYK